MPPRDAARLNTIVLQPIVFTLSEPNRSPVTLSEDIQKRFLPHTGWAVKIGSLVPASRRGFCLGTVLVNAVVCVGCWLAGIHVLALSPKLLAITGLGVQVALIRQRESNIQPKRKWRFGYAVAVAVLALAWVESATGVGAEDRIRTISQVALGGFIMFQIVILPVTASCCVRKSLPPR